MQPRTRDSELGEPGAAALPAVEHRLTVIIVDGDRVSQRAIELALARCDYTLEWARDGDAALEIMRQVRTDLVISDSMPSGMSGAALMRRAAELYGPAAPAFVFVTADRDVATRVALLAAGAADFVLKPFIADELRARVVNAIELRRPARTAATRGFTGLAGDCEYVPLADLLTMIELGRKSGTVDVSIGPVTGRLVVEDGRIVHAQLGTLSGEEACFALLRARGGLFRFQLGAIDARRTLNARVSELLLASAVREDTDQHWIDGDARQRTDPGLRELGIVKLPVKLRNPLDARAAAPSLVTAARRLRTTVADPFALGDLMLTATAPAEAIPELRLELWTATSDGVMALLGLASPPGYRFIASALQGDRGRLHLRFEIAGAALSVTLVDIHRTGERPAAPPHGIILAPPGGELIALSPQRLADLTGRLASDDSLAILALGGEALRTTVDRLIADAAPARAQTIDTTLDSDPRAILAGVLQLWLAGRGHAA